VVVHNNDSGRGLGDRGSKHFPRMNQGAVQQPARYQHLAKNLTLTVQREQVELLDLEITQPGTKQTKNVFGFPYSLHRPSLFPRGAGTQFEGGDESAGLGGTDAPGAQELRAGTLGQPAKRPLSELQELSGQLQHVLAASPCT